MFGSFGLVCWSSLCWYVGISYLIVFLSLVSYSLLDCTFFYWFFCLIALLPVDSSDWLHFYLLICLFDCISPSWFFWLIALHSIDSFDWLRFSIMILLIDCFFLHWLFYLDVLFLFGLVTLFGSYCLWWLIYLDRASLSIGYDISCYEFYFTYHWISFHFFLDKFRMFHVNALWVWGVMLDNM